MKLSGTQIHSFIEKKEDERVEFKRASSELPYIFALVDIGERSVMGLANLHGLWKKYGYAEPEITETYDPDRTVLIVTTDDDTVNATVTRPENGAEPDQNPTRTQPEPDQKCPKGAPRGDIKVDNKVDNNAKGDNKVDIKVDNNIWDDTVNRSRIGLEIRDDTENDTVNRFQTRNRTTTPYNTRTRSVQHSYKKQMYATSMDVWYNAHRTMISVEGRQ